VGPTQARVFDEPVGRELERGLGLLSPSGREEQVQRVGNRTLVDASHVLVSCVRAHVDNPIGPSISEQTVVGVPKVGLVCARSAPAHAKCVEGSGAEPLIPLAGAMRAATDPPRPSNYALALAVFAPSAAAAAPADLPR
jgi:hypothetical protein